MIYIYIISDPGTGVVRYVGMTNKAPTKRLQEHLAEAHGLSRNHRLNWLRTLSQPPLITAIEECASQEIAEAREIYWIALFCDYGHRLVNGTKGGDRGPAMFGAENPIFGKPRPESTKQKISRANTGRKHSKECREKQSERSCGPGNPFFGKRHSDSVIEANRLAHIGHLPTLETRKKISIAVSGSKNPFYNKTHIPEVLEIIRKANEKRNTSGQVGVSYDARKKKWVAYIDQPGGRIWAGTFKTFEEATAARQECVLRGGVATKRILATNTSGHPGVSFNKRKKKWEAYMPANDGRRRYVGAFLAKEDAIQALSAAKERVGGLSPKF